MVRFFGFAAGLVFVIALLVGALMPREAAVPDPIKAIHLPPRHVKLQHDGPLGMGVFGTFDRAQLQRGFQVYKEVCSACHGLERIAFRNLSALGFSEAEVKALAKAREVPSIDPATGEPSTRPALPSDHFPSPFPNEVAARAANNNALPPDLSLIIKARPKGQDYVYSLLTGYGKPVPKGLEVPEGLHFNPYFHSVNIAMAQPLNDGQVEYADGTPATVDQMAKDVVTFLRWTSEPELEKRRQMGVATVIFLSILTLLAFLTYRKVWAGIEH
ncbi:cytochrome c1 [Sandaracinobacteroides hominis]|uniref:cytochrome c1 n=1 Tax=Sandaracinobacteroides hominis TaxID=2780086 RepID=UPI0018F40441|nr:cytochrome c1 [Sandaracinobacteroides hominis]